MPKTHKFPLTGLILEFWHRQDPKIYNKAVREADYRELSQHNIPPPWDTESLA